MASTTNPSANLHRQDRYRLIQLPRSVWAIHIARLGHGCVVQTLTRLALKGGYIALKIRGRGVRVIVIDHDKSENDRLRGVAERGGWRFVIYVPQSPSPWLWARQSDECGCTAHGFVGPSYVRKHRKEMSCPARLCLKRIDGNFVNKCGSKSMCTMSQQMCGRILSEATRGFWKV